MTTPSINDTDVLNRALTMIVRDHGPAGLDDPATIEKMVGDLPPTLRDAVRAAAAQHIGAALVERAAQTSIHDAVFLVGSELSAASGLDLQVTFAVVMEFAFALDLYPKNAAPWDALSESAPGYAATEAVDAPAPGVPSSAPPPTSSKAPPRVASPPPLMPPPPATALPPLMPPAQAPGGAPADSSMPAPGSAADFDSAVFAPPPDVVPKRPKPKKSAVARAVERALHKGLLTFTTPESMRQGRKERVEVGIARDTELESELDDLMRSKAPRVTEVIETTDYMTVELIGDSFAIVPLSRPNQLVAPLARWEFDVTPTQAGEQTLTIVGTCWVTIDGEQREISLPSFERQISVGVDVMFSFRRAVTGNWQWIVGTLAGLGAAIAGWVELFK